MEKPNRLFEEKEFVSKNVFGRPVEPPRAYSLGRRRWFGIERLFLFNLVLLFLVGVLAIWYALWTNFVVSGPYQDGLLKKKLGNLTRENDKLLSEKSDSTNLGSLLIFAKSAGLVEQKNIEYLFDRRNVAEAPSNLAH